MSCHLHPLHPHLVVGRYVCIFPRFLYARTFISPEPLRLPFSCMCLPPSSLCLSFFPLPCTSVPSSHHLCECVRMRERENSVDLPKLTQPKSGREGIGPTIFFIVPHSVLLPACRICVCVCLPPL